MGGHDDPLSVKKNVYVEGIANYRDQIHERFFQRLNRRNVPKFLLCAFVFPAALYYGSDITLRQQQERMANARAAYKMPESRKINNGLQ
jgi:hypothetical protein